MNAFLATFVHILKSRWNCKFSVVETWIITKILLSKIAPLCFCFLLSSRSITITLCDVMAHHCVIIVSENCWIIHKRNRSPRIVCHRIQEQNFHSLCWNSLRGHLPENVSRAFIISKLDPTTKLQLIVEPTTEKGSRECPVKGLLCAILLRVWCFADDRRSRSDSKVMKSLSSSAWRWGTKIPKGKGLENNLEEKLNGIIECGGEWYLFQWVFFLHVP